MGLQKCRECKNKIKWSQIYKSLSLSYRPIVCSHCGTKHKITFASRILTGLIISIPLLVVLLPFAINQSLTISITIIVGFIYGLSILIILPYLVKYVKYDYV